eukprot:304131-Rhodomonas_salina.2
MLQEDCEAGESGGRSLGEAESSGESESDRQNCVPPHRLLAQSRADRNIARDRPLSQSRADSNIAKVQPLCQCRASHSKGSGQY